MKVAITAQGKDLNSAADPRFGRCQYFIIADTDEDDFKAVSNDSAQASGGAGTAAAQALVNQGVEAVITGNMGPNAMRVLQAADIKIYTTKAITVREALEQWKTGKTEHITASTVAGHHGGMGRGRGKGGMF